MTLLQIQPQRLWSKSFKPQGDKNKRWEYFVEASTQIKKPPFYKDIEYIWAMLHINHMRVAKYDSTRLTDLLRSYKKEKKKKRFKQKSFFVWKKSDHDKPVYFDWNLDFDLDIKIQTNQTKNSWNTIVV